MRAAAFALAAAVLAAALPATGRAQTVLVPGQPSQFTLAGGSFSTDLAVDVGAGIEQLRVEADAAGGGDVDLLLRFGEAFPVNGNAGVFGGVDWLLEHAHYRSVSPGGSERITVTRRQAEPVRAGRWYLSVINYSGQPATITLLATVSGVAPGAVPVTVAFDDAAGCAARQATTTPWFDSAPATPIGGNPGTTLGEQRRNAFNRAVALLRDELPGAAALRIRACWRDLGGSASSATLASAGPTYIFRNDGVNGSDGVAPELSVSSLPGLPSTYTWYTAAGAAQQTGTDLCRFASVACGEADIFIQFNSAVDGSTVLGNRGFHYGYDAPPPGGNQNIDFVATAMHEMGHGLGFIGLANLTAANGPIGEKFRGSYSNGAREPIGHNDAYTDGLVVLQGGTTVAPFNRLGLDARAAALTSGFNLRWAEAEAVDSPLNPRSLQAFPENLLPVYAPSAISGGSTLSHLDQSFNNQLMTPFIIPGVRSLGLARPMLSAVGWRSQPTPIPAYTVPYGGQWFDPDRNGHGIDLHRVEGAPDTYILMLYTFDAAGLPEWYIAIGRIVDGVFRPGNDANGNSLWRTRYLFGPPPGQQADASVPGQVRIDFNQAQRAPACEDDLAAGVPLALMTFSLAGDRNLKWCLRQIVPQSQRPALDRTGHWFAGDADAGWGLTTLGFGAGDGGVFTIVYYPDVQGRPRWAAAQANSFQSGAPVPLQQVQGYCRTCPRPPAGTTTSQVGEMRLSLDAPAGSQGQVRFQVQFAGPGGGSFGRDPAPMIRLAQSAPAGD
jgi:hypothetical protein